MHVHTSHAGEPQTRRVPANQVHSNRRIGDYVL